MQGLGHEVQIRRRYGLCCQCMSPDGCADGKKQVHESYARLILRRNVQVADQQKIRLSLKPARPTVHQEKGEVIQHIARRMRRIELEEIEQDGPIVAPTEVRTMQLDTSLPVASPSGPDTPKFGTEL